MKIGSVVKSGISEPVYLRIAVIDAVTSAIGLLAYKYVVSGPFAISVNPTFAFRKSLKKFIVTSPPELRV